MVAGAFCHAKLGCLFDHVQILRRWIVLWMLFSAILNVTPERHFGHSQDSIYYGRGRYDVNSRNVVLTNILIPEMSFPPSPCRYQRAMWKTWSTL